MTAATALKNKQEIAQVRTLLKQQYGPQAAQIWELGCLLGLRVSDLLGLKWSDIEGFDVDGYFEIVEQKTRFKKTKAADGSIQRTERPARRIYTNGRARSLLARMQADNPDHTYIFQSPRRSKNLGRIKPLDRTTVYKWLKAVEPQIQAARKRAGVLGRVRLSCHSWRKCFATVLLWAGKRIQEISRAIGHRSTAVTEVYLGIYEDEISNCFNDSGAFDW